MRKIYIVFISFCATLSVGCSNFLERSAQDLIIPETTAHYKELLQGSGYFKSVGENYHFINYMTDDVEFYDATKNTDKAWPLTEDNDLVVYSECYRWQSEIENESFTDECFNYLYNQALIANLCLEAVDDSKGTQDEKDVLKGQAAFSRAFAYFMIANIYGPAYNEAQPTDLCVPIKTATKPEIVSYPRATVGEVWGMIDDDLATAIACLKDKEISTKYEINYKAVLLLATRVALYEEKWDDVIALGKELLALNPGLFDISGKTASIANNNQLSDATVINFFCFDNPEIIFLFGNDGLSSEFWNMWSSITNVFFRNSQDSVSSIVKQFNYDATAKTGDRRKAYWFMPPATGSNSRSIAFTRYCYRPFKYDYYNDAQWAKEIVFRTAEVYLSMSEAYARKSSPDVTNSISYLNELRKNRIAPYTDYTSADFPSNEALVDSIWAERRRELCFEELHRWWDLRREGQPQIRHKWRDEVYTLNKNDKAYVLNVPSVERENNIGIESFSRPEKLAD